MPEYLHLILFKMRKIIKFSVKVIVILFTLSVSPAFSQSSPYDGNQLEHMSIYWHNVNMAVRMKNLASVEEYNTFTEFYHQHFDSIRGRIFADFKSGKLTPSNMKEYFKPLAKSTAALYKKYYTVVKEYPSSVSEFRHKYFHKPLTPCDSTGCTNIDFSNGTLSGWYAYYGSNSSESTSSFESVSGLTGGACGAVTKAAGPDVATGSTYQVVITSGTGTDALVPSITVVAPYAATYSARVGDSTNPNTGVAILEKTFFVTAANSGFIYQYAPILESAGHPYLAQPYFSATLYDDKGDTIPGCSKYLSVAGSNAGKLGFDSVFDVNSGDWVDYKNWSFVFISLAKYIGHCVTIQFQTGDCAYTAHFGYAYVAATCSDLKITASSPAICGSNVTLTAPIGGVGYYWTGPTGGIVGTDSARTITVDSAGTYSVVVVPYNGKPCADTLSITLPKAGGPPPIPSFLADTVCVGTPTQFINTSNPGPGPGVKYYWDFYNIGTFQDSSTSPLWTFSHSGTYTVKLYEINNGCGSDTLINVKVDSASSPGFTYSSTCVGQAVNFTNTSTNATTFDWNFGDPLSLINDSSKLTNPSHLFTSAGTYTVKLVSSTNGHCADTIKELVTISPAPKPVVNGNDSICAGSSATLTASGATTYTWMPGSLSGSIVTVFPGSTTTYTVSGSNGTCSHDTTFTVVVSPVPVGTITAKPDTICVGDSAKLIASGGTTYVWSPGGATTDSIWVKPAGTTTYTLAVTQNKCSANVTQVITVQSSLTMKLILSRDSICTSDSATLTIVGANSYTWSTGATTSSIHVNPSADSTFWVKAKNRCATDSLAKIIHVEPIPKPMVSGQDSICQLSSTTLTVTGGLKYVWSPGAMTGSSVTVTPATTTTYTVTASNGKCTHDTTFEVVVSPYPTPTISFSADSICPGDSVQLTATGGGTYSWAPGGMTSAVIWVKPSTATTYTVTVTKNNCSSSAFQSIGVYKIGTSSVKLTNNNICPNDTTTLAVIGGSSYKWSTGATTGTIHVNPATTTTYSVVVQVKCKIDTITEVVSVIPFPVITITGNTNICPGTPTVLTANGGTAYKWSTGSTNASITVSPKTNVTYVVQVFNGSCSKLDSVTVTMKAAPIVTITAAPNPVCEGQILTETATGGGIYQWSNGATTSSISVPATFADSLLYVVVSNGCSDTTYQRVTVLPVSYVTACCNDTIAFGSSVTLNASGAIGYVWTPNVPVSLDCYTCPATIATPSVATTYTVLGTDANGCVTDAEVTITIECAKYIIPNVFTPNGDNYNDVFLIKEIPDIAYSIEIFDRWGKKMFTSTNDQDPWNGKIDNSGANAPDGVYYYIIKSTCNGVNREDHGFVQLIR